MTIDKLRERLAEKLQFDMEWVNVLDNSSPGHYGVQEWEASVDPRLIWVDIPNRTFTFKNASFDFEVRLGASRKENSEDMSFSRVAEGKGEWDFSSNGRDVEIQSLEIEVELDLFATA